MITEKLQITAEQAFRQMQIQRSILENMLPELELIKFREMTLGGVQQNKQRSKNLWNSALDKKFSKKK